MSVISVQEFGNQIIINMDDGSKLLGYPTGNNLWIVSSGADTPPTGDDIYNPWSAYNVSGTWADHGSYSAGGIDYPLGYGTAILAPANGTLHTSGGSGEYAAGQVGSAGRRSILYLDASFVRKAPAESYPPEANGPLVAIVFQHQSVFGTDLKHYNKGETVGWSGASANGDDYGGDVHLHVHGLDSAGNRVDVLKFIL